MFTRAKNSLKEILVHSRNQAPPNLPLSIRITRTTEEEWTQNLALSAFTQHLEMKLEEKVLRYKLSLKDRLFFEWSWQEELSRGGLKCTILAHISAGTNVLSIQNKRHIHWKVLEAIPGMNNEIEFSTSAHNLLLKTRPTNADRQAHKNKTASIQALPQAARKKRYTKLDLAHIKLPRTNNASPTCIVQEAEDKRQETSLHNDNKTLGSIGSFIALNCFTHD